MTIDDNILPERLAEISDAAGLLALSNDPERPALVLFHVGWHEPGRRLEERLMRLDAVPTPISLAQVDIDRSPELARMFGVVGAPALLLFRGGQVAARRLGEVEDGDLAEWLENVLAA